MASKKKTLSTEDMISNLERRNKVLSTLGAAPRPKPKPKPKPKKQAYSPEQSAEDWMNLA
jgi:hypothetical protein